MAEAVIEVSEGIKGTQAGQESWCGFRRPLMSCGTAIPSCSGLFGVFILSAGHIG